MDCVPSEEVAKTLALRERISQIKIELEALLDAEQMSGRFSRIENSDLRGWAEALIALHPDTARTVFRAAFGSEFLIYRHAFENALKSIRDGGLASEFESRARPADEETQLTIMEMRSETRAKEENERLRIELTRAKRLYPEAFNVSDLEKIDLAELLQHPDKCNED